MEIRNTMRLVMDFIKEDRPAVRELVDRELWLKASPLIRKVVLNPKIYLFYDYALNSLGYQGDIGDFLADCVEDYFASRGYKILIQKTSEVD